jgi:hypothetical protein
MILIGIACFVLGFFVGLTLTSLLAMSKQSDLQANNAEALERLRAAGLL